jgi:hypothetical protein
MTTERRANVMRLFTPVDVDRARSVLEGFAGETRFRETPIAEDEMSRGSLAPNSVSSCTWVQIVEWYDELLRFGDTPIVRLNRAVAVGEADGAPSGLAALADIDDNIPRRDAVAAYLHERNGDLELAARLYASAARNAPNSAERDHQTRQAARLNQLLRRHQ